MAFNEFEIYQNQTIGAHILWEFSKSYYINKDKKLNDQEDVFPTLLHTFPVLPLCFNSRVVEGIHSRNFKEGGILRALNDNKDLFSGLQDRMVGMSSLTLNSIHLAHASNLIHFDRDTMLLIPRSITLPIKIERRLGKDYKDMIASSKRIGYWFSKLSMSEILMYFNISF